MEHLFAPWRYAYVSNPDSTGGCIFCASAHGEGESLTLVRGERSFALLNRFPYTSGHTMVAPYAHVGDFTELDGPTLADMMHLVQKVVRALRDTYQPHGFNIGLNLGEAAGAGITDHLHVHVVPRWRGDTNFMTVNAGVRVVPEDLTQARVKLRTALGEQGA